MYVCVYGSGCVCLSFCVYLSVCLCLCVWCLCVSLWNVSVCVCVSVCIFYMQPYFPLSSRSAPWGNICIPDIVQRKVVRPLRQFIYHRLAEAFVWVFGFLCDSELENWFISNSYKCLGYSTVISLPILSSNNCPGSLVIFVSIGLTRHIVRWLFANLVRISEGFFSMVDRCKVKNCCFVVDCSLLRRNFGYGIGVQWQGQGG